MAFVRLRRMWDEERRKIPREWGNVLLGLAWASWLPMNHSMWLVYDTCIQEPKYFLLWGSHTYQQTEYKMWLGWIPIQTPLSCSLGQFYHVVPAANPRDVSQVLLLTKYMDGWLQIWCHHQRGVSERNWNSLSSAFAAGKNSVCCYIWCSGACGIPGMSVVCLPHRCRTQNSKRLSLSEILHGADSTGIHASKNKPAYSSLKIHVKAVPMTNSMFSNLKSLLYAWKRMKAGPHELRPSLLKVVWGSCLYSSQTRKGSTIMESGTQSKPLPEWCNPWLVVYPWPFLLIL